MNKIIVVGRFTADPEIRTTQSGKSVLSFTVAVDRKIANANGNREADFIDCVAFEKTAEFLTRYFSKGMRIAIEGRLQTRTYEDKNGTKHKVCEVIVENCEFVEGKKDGNAAPVAPATTATPAPANNAPANTPAQVAPQQMTEAAQDDDLPF